MPKKTLAGSSKEAVIKTDWSALGVTDQTVAEVDRLIKDEKSGGYSRHTLMMDAGLRRKLEGDLTNLTSRSAQQSGSQDSTFGTDNADVTELFASESKDDAEGMTPDPELTPVSIKKKLSQRLEDLDNWTHTKKASEQDRRDGEAMVQHINQCMNIVMDCAIELNDRTDNKMGKQIDHLSTVYNAQIMEVAKLQKRQFADLSAAVKHESQGVRNETALSLAQMNQRIGGVESGVNEIKNTVHELSNLVKDRVLQGMERSNVEGSSGQKGDDTTSTPTNKLGKLNVSVLKEVSIGNVPNTSRVTAQPDPNSHSLLSFISTIPQNNEPMTTAPINPFAGHQPVTQMGLAQSSQNLGTGVALPTPMVGTATVPAGSYPQVTTQPSFVPNSTVLPQNNSNVKLSIPNSLSRFDPARRGSTVEGYIYEVRDTARVMAWTDEQLRYVMKSNVVDAVKAHLRTFQDREIATWQQVEDKLKARYGSSGQWDLAPSEFYYLEQETKEDPQNFLDRLLDHRKRIWPDEVEEAKGREIINVFLRGLKATKLQETLRSEYRKPEYRRAPPPVSHLRDYVQRLMRDETVTTPVKSENVKAKATQRGEAKQTRGADLNQRLQEILQPSVETTPKQIPKPEWKPMYPQAAAQRNAYQRPRNLNEIGPCHECGEYGHLMYSCPKLKERSPEVNRMESVQQEEISDWKMKIFAFLEDHRQSALAAETESERERAATISNVQEEVVRMHADFPPPQDLLTVVNEITDSGNYE